MCQGARVSAGMRPMALLIELNAKAAASASTCACEVAMLQTQYGAISVPACVKANTPAVHALNVAADHSYIC